MFCRKIVKTQDIRLFKKKKRLLFLGISLRKSKLKEENQLKNFGDIIKKWRKIPKKRYFTSNLTLFTGMQGFILSLNDLAGVYFSSKKII